MTGCSEAADLTGGQPTPTTTETSAPTPTATTPEPTTTRPPEPQGPVPAAGQCRRLSRGEALLGVALRPGERVPCRADHNGQTYFVGKLSKVARKAALRGNRNRVYAQESQRCRRELVDWLGGDGSDLAQSQFGFVVGVPSAEDLAAGARWARCDAIVNRTGRALLSLPRDTKRALAGGVPDRFRVCAKGDIEQAKTVVCTLPHRWRGVSALRLGAADARFPGGNVLSARMRSTCETQVRSYLGTTAAFSYGWIRPTKASWRLGGRYGVCFAKLSS